MTEGKCLNKCVCLTLFMSDEQMLASHEGGLEDKSAGLILDLGHGNLWREVFQHFT